MYSSSNSTGKKLDQIAKSPCIIELTLVNNILLWPFAAEKPNTKILANGDVYWGMLSDKLGQTR